MTTEQAGAVIIGRNEGTRLVACLAAATRSGLHPIIYVDSGSTDGSLEAARQAGAEVVLLDHDQPFTAARARNAGLARLIDRPEPPIFVQFIDGDCALREGWVATAVAFLQTHPQAAAACGRRRERFPEASPYNAAIDREWDSPVGQTRSCGGDVMIRVAAIEAAGRYNPQLIAGEEPELCLRLRRAGWTIWRLDAEMTWHDAALTRFSQWWIRSRRAGHAFAEGAAMNGAAPERHYVPQLARALLWGLVLPLAILIGLLFTPWALMLALLWPLKVARLMTRGRTPSQALLLTVGNIAESVGALEYFWKRATGRRSRIIEYK